MFAFQAAKRLAVLDAEHEGLVFGRLDRTDGEIRYIGRIGVRDADYEPLVIDWRAPAAEPFYRATPANPMEVVRRRVLRCSRRPGDRHRGRPAGRREGRRRPGGDRRGRPDGRADPRAAGTQMRDIVATIQSEQDEAIRAPWQGFTLISGGPGTGKTVVALHRAAYLLYSQPAPVRERRRAGRRAQPGVHELHRAGAALARRGLGRPCARSARSPPTCVRLTGDRVDAAAAAAIKGSLRMVAVLKQPGQRAPAGRCRSSCG